MKLVKISILLLLYNSVAAQQVINIGGAGSNNVNIENKGIQTGQPVTGIKLTNLMNSDKQSVSLTELKGKIIILEFWATWCGPCIPAIGHLDELKKKFPDQLEVIAISDETEARIQRFIKNKPSSIWFSTDPDHSLQKYFPFHAIPHSVIIDQSGKLVANTSPMEITENVIKTILNEQKISVKEKKDVTGGFDMTKDYFPRPPGFNEYSFEVQPPIPGGFPITRRITGTSEWSGRRITMLNNPVSIIYRIAFNKTSATTVYEGVAQAEFDHRTTKDLYCIDVIVPKGRESELYSYMQQQLLKLNLKYKCRVEKRQTGCVVITSADPSKLEPFRSAVTNNESAKQPTIIRATSYERKNVPLDDLFLHFENYGIIKQPVINETGINGNFDLTFQFDAENPDSFKNELAKLGLKAEKKEREVEVLVIYKAE